MFLFSPKFENNVQRLAIRLVTVGLSTLILCVLINQFHGEGIRWKVLMVSLPLVSNDDGWQYASTDSCFAVHLQQSADFIDVRDSESFEIDHVPGAFSMPFQKLFDGPSTWEERDRETTLILYDELRHSKRARLAARYLSHMGFHHVVVLRGGYIEWLDRTFPVEAGEL